MSSAREGGASPSVPGLRHAAARAVFPALTPPSTTGETESGPPPRKHRGRGKKKARRERSAEEEIPLPGEPPPEEPMFDELPPPDEPPEELPEALPEEPNPEAGPGDSGPYRRVEDQPRQGSDTLAWGASPRCGDCGSLVGGRQEVVLGPEGWCIATLCGCDQPWYTQESAVYEEAAEAEAALESGDYELP